MTGLGASLRPPPCRCATAVAARHIPSCSQEGSQKNVQSQTFVLTVNISMILVAHARGATPPLKTWEPLSERRLPAYGAASPLWTAAPKLKAFS